MALDMVYLPHPRRAADRALLVREANATRYIALLTVADLERLEADATIFYAYAGAEAAGFGAWQRVTRQWDEIGPFFNREAFRGQGLGRQMFHDVLAHREGEGRSMYVVTRNPAVWHILKGFGFAETTLRGVPLALMLHVVTRFNLRRLAAGLRKLDRSERTIHLVKRYPYGPSRIE